MYVSPNGNKRYSCIHTFESVLSSFNQCSIEKQTLICYLQGRRNRCGRSGGCRTNVQHTNHKIIIIILKVLRTLNSFTTRIWTGNETTYSTYLATYAHMDVTTFNMAETHFPAEHFRPTKAFCSPKRQFDCKGDQRSFYAERCDMLSWLHYTMLM